MSPLLTARTLHTGMETLEHAALEIQDGRIVSIATTEPDTSVHTYDTLTPTFLDIHVHGAVGFDFMRASLAEMEAVGRFLARRGVGHYLPTTVTSTLDATLGALGRLTKFVQASAPEDAAKPLGLHLEGPFLCPAKRGVHSLELLLAPSVATFDRMQQAAEGQIRLLTLAPEMPGALELIGYAVSQGVRVSMGHSNATAAETAAAIRAGATSATHLFNAMHALDHREPGIAGEVLTSPEVFAEAIIDGVHIHPAMVKLWYTMKGRDRAMLVTDGMAATGMPEGTYHLGDMVVEVKDGVCRSGGVLAGSVLTMERAVANLRAITGVDLGTAVRLGSINPATMLGYGASFGLAAGAPANFNIYSAEGQRQGTVLHGVPLPL